MDKILKRRTYINLTFTLFLEATYFFLFLSKISPSLILQTVSPTPLRRLSLSPHLQENEQYENTASF